MIDLQAAVNKVQTLWLEIGSNSVSREVMAKTIGYSSLNGTAITALSALHQYGLIQNTHASGWSASPIAAAIFEAESREERLNAIRLAFVKPDVFEQIYEEFGNLAGDVRKMIDASSYLETKGFNSEHSISKLLVNYVKSSKYANLADPPSTPMNCSNGKSTPINPSGTALQKGLTKYVDFKDWQRLQVGGRNFVFRIMTLGGQNPNIEELEDLSSILELKLKRMKGERLNR